MKLSDIHGERVFDVIADIIDPIANIAEDEKASAMFRREKIPEGMTAKEFAMQRARKALPALLKQHKGGYHRYPFCYRRRKRRSLQGDAESRKTDAGRNRTSDG